MNNMKLSQIMRYIKQYPFEYEIEEVEENLPSIMLDYGIEDELSQNEMQLLKQEFLGLAEKFEFREAARLAFQEPLLA